MLVSFCAQCGNQNFKREPQYNNLLLESSSNKQVNKVMLAAFYDIISIKKDNKEKYYIDEGKVQVKLRIESKCSLPEIRTFFEIRKKGFSNYEKKNHCF